MLSSSGNASRPATVWARAGSGVAAEICSKPRGCAPRASARKGTFSGSELESLRATRRGKAGQDRDAAPPRFQQAIFLTRKADSITKIASHQVWFVGLDILG